MPGTFFKSGTWNAICDICGMKYKMSELRKNWAGLIVCHKDFEQDHPQKYIRVRESGLSVPVIRDRPEDVFLGSTCTLWGSSGYADLAEADCARADVSTIPYTILRDLKTASDVPDGTFT